MGYRIHYGEKVEKVNIPDSSRKSTFSVLTVVILIFCCIFAIFLSRQADVIEKFLLPGDAEVTKAAFSSFAENLRCGDSIQDAVVSFCREIIENANIKN